MSGHYYPSPDIDPAPLPMATHPGQHINDAVRRAVAMAGEHKRRVSFAFNDVSMTVDPDDTEDDVLARWEADNTARAEAYRISPAGIAAAAAMAERIAQAQRDHDRLMAELPGIVDNEAALIQWCVDFGQAADWIGVSGRDYPKAIGLMEAAGWKAGDCVGWDKKYFVHPRIIARWVIGQAMARMAEGVPPLGITAKFAETYRDAMKARAPADPCAVAAAVKAEREACAMICEDIMEHTRTPLRRAKEDAHDSEINHQEGRWHAANDAMRAIRARTP